MHVPYKGTGPAIADLIGGQVQVSFGTLRLGDAARAGAASCARWASPARSVGRDAEPADLRRGGLAGFEAPLWYCLLAPAQTPQPIVAKLNDALVQALKSPQLEEQLGKQGFEPSSSNPAQLKEIIAKDLVRWARFISETGIKVEQ